MIETVAEAQTQEFSLPDFKQWRTFARTINGYTIAEELGLDFTTWTTEQVKQWKETNHWDLDILQLRIMLFYAFRSDYMTGYTYTEHDDMADSLMQAISKKSGHPYTPKQ